MQDRIGTLPEWQMNGSIRSLSIGFEDEVTQILWMSYTLQQLAVYLMNSLHISIARHSCPIAISFAMTF